MPRFVTIGYGDQAGYDRTPPDVIAAAHDNDARLLERGAIMGIAGSPVQVRNPDGTGLEVESGRFSDSALPIAGFGIIEAVDLADAQRKMAGSPCAVAHGVIEVWPLEELEPGD